MKQGEETYILESSDSYHTWEDGRGNYAWDLSAINSNMYTYSGYGSRLRDFAVFGLDVYLPLGGIVAHVASDNPDNAPDMTNAVGMGEAEDGTEVELEEKPNNGVEVTPGGPFLLRVIHQQQVILIISHLSSIG